MMPPIAKNMNLYRKNKITSFEIKPILYLPFKLPLRNC